MKVLKKAGLLIAMVSGLVSGCGGGDGSSSPAFASASVSGTAATGAAIPGGTVSMSCVSGASATTTTGSDGSYALSVTGITFPCVARVSYGTADKLHTFVSGTGTANITPVTELLLANLTGGSAADAFDKFDATKAKALTAAQVTAAIAAVKAYLVTLGVSVADFPADPIGVKLTAKAGTVSGDKFDAVLDDLQAKLKAASKKLSDAVAEVSKGGSATGTGTTAAGTLGTLTVTNAAKASRNGSFAVGGGLFVNQDSSGFNGDTKDGLFETETSWVNGTNAVLKAAVWYFEGANSIIFFACDNGQNKPCKNITYDGKTLTFNNAVLPETGGTTSVTVNGSIAVK